MGFLKNKSYDLFFLRYIQDQLTKNYHILKHSVKVALIIIGVLIIDQALKFWIKTNMHLNEDSFEDWDWWTASWGRIPFCRK